MTSLTPDTTSTSTTATGPTDRQTAPGAPAGERAELIASLTKARFFLRLTCRDLTDDQAARRTTVSRLCLAGLIKHVTATELAWTNFATGRPGGPGGMTETSVEDHERTFEMLPGESLSGLLEAYAQVARATDEVVATIADLDREYPLPVAPWFEPGARWSVRQVLLHIIAETAQHAGHADIIREALDGAKSMG